MKGDMIEMKSQTLIVLEHRYMLRSHLNAADLSGEIHRVLKEVDAP